MIVEIKIPSPGESVTEVQLSAWLVNDNDFVSRNQEIGEVESDKATLPLIAAESGRIHFLSQPGDTLKVGATACTIDTEVVTKDELTKSLIHNETPTKDETIDNIQHKETKEPLPDLKITPLGRKLMEENNLSVEELLSGLTRIGKNEIEAVLNQRAQNNPPTKVPINQREEERTKLSPLRKKLSERLVAVKNQTAMLTTFNEIDMSKLMSIKNQYQSAFKAKYNVKLGFMSFFLKASAEALKYHPLVNSRIVEDEIITPTFTDISVAVQTQKGLLVPVIRNVNNLSIAELEVELARLAEKARASRLSIEEMTGGTFSITNGGVFGSLFSTPLINPPQSAILGMHNIIERPFAENGQVVVRPLMYVALSYDHRIIDGKDAVGVLVKIKKFIENPHLLLSGSIDPEKDLLNI
jgi:2-oxoglutarate dehydrogenase E2 component (dihydrolipoamide succinyltransferase)